MKVTVEIAGLRLEPINRRRFASLRGARGHARTIREQRTCVRLHVLGALRGRDRRELPCRVVVTRLSAGELDRGAVWEALKPAWDGIADAFGLADDRELQRSGDVSQATCKRGTYGVRVELFYADASEGAA